MRPAPLRFFAVAAVLLAAAHFSAAAAAPGHPADVTNVIVPFVKAHCLPCHDDQQRQGDVSLAGFANETSIFKARKLWSRAIEALHAGEMPPEDRPKPAFADAERFATAVRNVFTRFDRTAARDPGVVTMRRLSRSEYVNTVRDLVGVTIPLAEDFPADQIGHGFDNLGEFLTLSPLQFERYLAAAEAIVNAAIVVGEPAAPSFRAFGGVHQFRGFPNDKNYDNQGRRVRDAEGKPLPKEAWTPHLPGAGDGWRVLYDKGPVHRDAGDLTVTGEYTLTLSAQGLFVGDEPPQFALLANGAEVSRGTLTEKTATYSVPLRLKAGQFLDIGVSLLNGFIDPADPTRRRGLVLQSMSLVAPRFPESHERLFGGGEKLTGDDKSRFVLERFASRAFRRPATGEEVDRLVIIVHEAEKIPYFRLGSESLAKLQDAKLPGPVVNNLRSLEKERFADEERFLSLVQERLRKEEWYREHRAAILEAAEKVPQPWERRIRLAVRAVLCSPQFLFRVELDSRPDEAGPRPIDDYQLASRLSYFLWSSMPDQELFDLAAAKRLHEQLPAQVKRMLADPRSRALADNFATQWLGLGRLEEFTPAPEVLGEMQKLGGGTWGDLRRDMLTETGLFFHELVREDRSILDLLDARFTYLNERLARLYGIGDTNGNPAGPKIKPINPAGAPIPGIQVLERGQDPSTIVRSVNPFVRVSLENTQRGGILTQASVLALTSHPKRTSPVKRGHWVLERILGTPPPPPPPSVPGLEQTTSEQPLSLRRQTELHRKDPNCAGCHARIDPIGFALETFDPIGRYRDKEGDQPIDASGELPGGKAFSGATELKSLLRAERELVSRNLAEDMLVYATGRGPDIHDVRTVDEILAAVEKQDYRFQALITAIVQSDAFRMRRGKAPGTETERP
jgi:hypothetical protein